MSPGGALAVTAAIFAGVAIVCAIVAGMNWMADKPNLFSKRLLAVAIMIMSCCIVAWVAAIWMAVQWR